MKKDIYRLKINDRFAQIAPPLKRYEREMLERSIIENGCQMPLVVWDGTIVDGHNRYRICREHRIPFTYEEMDFNSEGDAIIWIIKNQLGRRNLSSYARCEMVLRFEPQMKADAEKHRREAISRYRRTGEISGAGMTTAEILAGMIGVSRSTLQTAKAVCLSGDEEIKERARNGEVSISFAYRTIRGKNIHASEKAGNTVGLEEIRSAVSELTKKVADGEASQRVMLESLDHISDLIDDAEGRA